MFARIAFTALSAALVLALAAPAMASDARREAREAKREARLELALAHAGEPVDRVRFLLPAHTFEVVGPHSVLVFQTPRRAWLVDVRDDAGCQHLVNTIAIQLDTLTETDSLNTSNGYIVGDNNMRCKITSLREVDVPGMRAASADAVASAS